MSDAADGPKKQQQKAIAKTKDELLNTLINKYLAYEQIEANKQFIEQLLAKNELETLQALVGKRLDFGTAGLRGRMGPGFGQMNDLVIIETSQGLASYLMELESQLQPKERGVIIGHDARHNSDRFARLAALAFLQKGISVYYCDHLVPTPLVAFGVKHFGCCAGIVVTASHNPKQDNGYKVYWSNGAQILSPHDENIQRHIMLEENLKPWPRAWEQELLKVQNQAQLPRELDELLFRIHGDLSKSYFTYIEHLVGDRRPVNRAASICITYTSMHGVGHNFLSRALDLAGFDDVFPVESQKKPDPNFSTVKFPNPEEAGALDLAFETAKHANSNLILAVDPDADRCAVALYSPPSDQKRVLNGNETGSLLAWWSWFQNNILLAAEGHDQDRAKDLGFRDSQGSDLLDNFSSETGVTAATSEHSSEEAGASSTGEAAEETNANKLRKPSDCYMISTAVSSKFIQSMARVEGFQFIETLTGFKYMGNLAHDLITKHDKSVLFAYEEAIGYMVNSAILDKDGIAAAIQVAQCAAYVGMTYKRTLEQHLDWLYTRYGYHYNLNSYYICSDSQVIREIFQNLQADYPTNFGPEFKVRRVRDLNKAYDSGTLDQKPDLPTSTGSYMVTFFVDKDITFTIRTSGTEPKIKYYSEIVAKLPAFTNTQHIETNNFNDPEQLAAKRLAQRRLGRLVEAAIERCLKPNQYELEAAD